MWPSNKYWIWEGYGDLDLRMVWRRVHRLWYGLRRRHGVKSVTLLEQLKGWILRKFGSSVNSSMSTKSLLSPLPITDTERLLSQVLVPRQIFDTTKSRRFVAVWLAGCWICEAWTFAGNLKWNWSSFTTGRTPFQKWKMWDKAREGVQNRKISSTLCFFLLWCCL